MDSFVLATVRYSNRPVSTVFDAECLREPEGESARLTKPLAKHIFGNDFSGALQKDPDRSGEAKAAAAGDQGWARRAACLARFPEGRVLEGPDDCR